jgi:fatty acid amide hydrolase
MTFDRTDPLVHGSATDLVQLLERREVSAEEVVRAHVDRAITIESRVNAFVESLRGEALERAKAIDAARARGEHVGPLAGLPISIKENLDMAGHASTLGIEHRRRLRAAEDAVVVQAVKRAGGIPVGRSNVPQLLLSHETRNPVFGVTKNPFSLAHAPGGSSGGEGAALASGLSALGVGTDIGGSIRIPAAWCGIAGLKPTLDRWSNRGSNGALVGQEVIRSQVGPMARTARDVAFVFRALEPRFMAERDPLVCPFAPERAASERGGGRPRVGFFDDDGVVGPSAAVRRAVAEARSALSARGFDLVPFRVPEMEKAVALYFGLMSSDGGVTAQALIGSSAIEPALAPLLRTAQLPRAARLLLVQGLRAAGEGRIAGILANLSEKRVSEVWRLTKAARDLRLAILAAMREARVDVLLGPPHATPAVPHEKSAQFLLAGSYAMVWNLVQFPAGVVPVTTVRSDETTRRSERPDRVEKVAIEVDRASAGLPVGVQVVGRPFEDEVVLEVMIALEEELGPGRPVTPRMPGEA